MLDWWQWVLFPPELIRKYGLDPDLRKLFVGTAIPYTYRFARTIGLWGWASRAHMQDTFGGTNRSLVDLEMDRGLSISWDTLIKRVDRERLAGVPRQPTYPHLALMQMIYAREVERMRQEPLSVPAAAALYDVGLRKRTRYGVTSVEVVRYFQTQVQLLREYRITFSVWRSWNEEQQQAAWVQGNYSIALPAEAHRWARANARRGAARYEEPPVDHTLYAAPPDEVPLADLRGTLPVAKRHAKAPRTLQRRAT